MFKKKNSINNRLEAPIPEFKEAKKTKRKPTARQPKPPKIKEKKQKKPKTFKQKLYIGFATSSYSYQMNPAPFLLQILSLIMLHLFKVEMKT